MPDLRHFFDHHTIPLRDWLQHGTTWLVDHIKPFFRAVQWPVAKLLDGLAGLLHGVPVLVFLLVLLVVAWRLAGPKVAWGSVAAMLFVGFLGLWDPAMTTYAMIVTSVAFCVLTGVPLGVLAGRSDGFERAIRPVLDAMQTTPSFVYLAPIVVLFGIGTVPGVLATIIVALPPMIRLTSLGIRQVDEELVEAGYAFGSTSRQVLWEIQLPLAMPSVMTGLNQSLMQSLSMVVMVALIGAGGLGLSVFQGINQLDIGLAGIGGIAIVFMAISLDRITQSAATKRRGWMRPRAHPGGEGASEDNIQ